MIERKVIGSKLKKGQKEDKKVGNDIGYKENKRVRNQKRIERK